MLNNSNGNKIKIKGDRTKITVSIGIAVILFVAIIAFGAFGSSVEKKIVGNWKFEDTGEVWSFTRSGQFINLTESNEGMTISYSIDGNKLQLDIQYLWEHYTVIADIEIANDVLTLSNIIDPGNTMGADEGETIRMVRTE